MSYEKRLIFVALNEVNLELGLAYAERNNLLHLKRVFAEGVRRTESETQYEELEPWVQWVSAHTGLTAAEHGIFRLGDIVGSCVPQYFEQVEAAGFSVGSISAMNAENRLSAPAYFIPDPWTVTPTDDSVWSGLLGAAISQAANDNSNERLSKKSIFVLFGGLLRFSKLSNYARYLNLALRSRRASWRKALFLDLFLHDLHLNLFKKKQPNFSTIFLNAGAHIQHRYLFNARAAVTTELRNPEWYASSDVDPFEEALVLYDKILGDYMAMDDVDLIVATGLTQKPYDRVKYYWRLKDHAAFLAKTGIEFREVFPRMTRDFLIEFDSAADAEAAEKQLSRMTAKEDGMPIFGAIDNRGASLFVTLTYSNPIDVELIICHEGATLDLRPEIAFVAIKNGMHDSRGFVYYKGQVSDFASADGLHVKELYSVVMRYFGVKWPGRETKAEAPV